MRLYTGSARSALGALALLYACGTEAPAPAADNNESVVRGPAGPCLEGQVADCACPNGAAGRALCRPNLTFSACLCGTTGTDPDPITDPQQMGTAGPSGLPCEVESVVEQHCGTCHGAMLQFTAPMRLVTWEDFQAPTPSNPSVPVYQTVMQRVQHPNSPMPPAPNARLSAPEIAALNAWVGTGAARSSAVCGNDGSAGGGSIDDPMMMDDPLPGDVECFDFLASNGSGQAYNVPTTPDYYHCFNFKAPWTGDVQAVRATSVIDNSASVHHWILYTAPGVNQNGVGGACSGQHSNGQFVVGWAPGANDMEMPDGVGLEIPKTGFQLEVHYNAPSAGQKDASGVKLCVTKQLRPNTAAVHPLGQEWLAPTTGAGNITGTCQPAGPFPITIISSSPHMHKKGTHMKTVIMRAGGAMETLIDQAFDFNTQLAYDTPAVINQGDRLVTTCTFNSGVTYGTGTNDEMCYNFVTAYPAGALAGGGGLSNNGNTCIQPSFGF